MLKGELFDITPYAGAYVRYFVRHPTTQAMPRKVKTAFTATDEDNAITRIHDMAFVPRERDGVRGVEIRVGGGTSIMPLSECRLERSPAFQRPQNPASSMPRAAAPNPTSMAGCE